MHDLRDYIEFLYNYISSSNGKQCAVKIQKENKIGTKKHVVWLYQVDNMNIYKMLVCVYS